MQLHRVGLDGPETTCGSPIRSSITLSRRAVARAAAVAGASAARVAQVAAAEPAASRPDNKYFVDVYQTHDQPPALTPRFVDVGPTARFVAQLAKSDLTKFDQIGFKKAEMSYLQGSRRRQRRRCTGRSASRPTIRILSKKYHGAGVGLRRTGLRGDE